MLDPAKIRSQFPALARKQDGEPLVYFDGPGGTQVPQAVIDAIVDYLSRCNANHGGVFITGVESDKIVGDAHEAMADFLNAGRREEIVFGANMTTLTYALSRSLGNLFNPGDEVIVTLLDHDANYSPWVQMAKDRGMVVRVVDVRTSDCTLDMDGLERFLGPKTRLIAVGYASNAVGTINPVERIVKMAHSVGALVFVDAVHFAPHGAIDVQRLKCDFLACSPYKFFAPHLGVLYGRHDLLASLPAYKVRPAGDQPPDRFETGTQNHEALAGLLGAMAYLDSLPEGPIPQSPGSRRSIRSARLEQAMHAIQAYEHGLKVRMLEGLMSLESISLYGIRDFSRISERVPTFAIRVNEEHPRETARKLAGHGICVWDGNYYALNLTERLDLEETGGMVRIGLAHYNTRGEIDRFLQALADIAA